MKMKLRELKKTIIFCLIVSTIFTLFFSLKVDDSNKTAIMTQKIQSRLDVEEENAGMQVVEELIDGEENNFEINLYMYDSTVDNGKTALTEIAWDATTSQTRIVTVQINYRSVDSSLEYNPGDLNIKVDNLGYICPLDEEYSTCLEATSIGADFYSSPTKEYEWSYEYDSENHQYIFTNNNFIEAETNFEGSIQLVYQIESTKVLNNSHVELKAILNDSIESLNTVTFDFTSTERVASVSLNASGLLAYDGLIENSANYTWIKYNYSVSTSGSGVRGGIYDDYIIAEVEEGSIVFNSSLEEIQPQEDGYYLLKEGSGYIGSYTSHGGTFYVAYPLELYQNQTIIASVLWYGKYRESYYYKGIEKELQELGQASRESITSDFEITYDGDLSSIHKYGSESIKSYNKLINAEYGEDFYFNISSDVIYTGETYDAIIGDDLLFITNEEGQYRKLEDDEYYFEYIYFDSNNIENANGIDWEEDRYTIKLFVRYQDDTEYVEYAEFLNSDYIDIYFDEDEKVVAWYFEIYDLQESMIMDYSLISTNVYVQTDTDIAFSGSVCNFNYLKIYTTDENGNKVLINEGSLDGYGNDMTNENIGEYDIEKHGTYIERDYSSTSYYEDDYVNLSVYNDLYDTKRNSEYFYKDYSVSVQINNSDDYCSGAEAFTGYRLYTLLPEGAELNTTEDEIIKNISFDGYNYFYNEYGEYMDYSEYVDFITERLTVEIVENFRDSNKTWIAITVDYSDCPLNSYDLYTTLETYYLPIKIPVESYFLYGNNYDFESYVTFLNEEEIYLPYYYNDDWYDIDNDNNEYDFYTSENYASAYIIMAVSSHQEVKKLIKTEHTGDDYVSGTVMVKNGEEYSYKLRIKTGINSVKNLVIYDNLECLVEDSWRGEFLGLDTSFAEAQGYDVTVWYSDEENPGTLLENPDSWNYYDEYIDKESIRALAFDYGENTITPATMTCVEINMRVPENTETEQVVRNRCYTNWNAVTPTGEIIDNVVGINSNIVNLAFPESVDDIKIQKIWEDNEDELGVRPESVGVTLYRNDEYYETITLDDENNWEYTFEDMLLFDINEESYVYTIEEESVNLYHTDVEQNYMNPVVGTTFEITNKLLNKVFVDITGTKKWIDDEDLRGKRPEEITINLYRDGEFVTSTTTNAEKNWKYEFLGYQLWKNNNEQYEYTIDEVVDSHYNASIGEMEDVPGKGIEIVFSEDCRTEQSCDWVEIFYELDGTVYKTERLSGSNFARKSIKIPTEEFYLHWRTDGSVCGYYGFSIDSISEITDDNYSNVSTSSLPNYDYEELEGKNYPESEHNYSDNINQYWHYTFVSEQASQKVANIENSLKRIDTTILVHHYIEGTETKLAEDELINGYVWDTYTTSPSANVPVYYEVVEMPENAIGEFTEEQIEITYYYKYKEFLYTIEYYYEGVLDEEKTEYAQATYQEIIEDYVDKNIEGYELEKTENLPLTITENENTNIIKVYYISINPDYKTIGYTVEYYKDGEIVEEDTQVVIEKVEVLAPDTLIINKDEINITDKYIGYKFESTDPEVIPDEVTDGDVIKVYYVKDEFEYKVEYYYDGVLDEEKTEYAQATYQEIIEDYIDKNIEGYELEKTENLPLTITENENTNIIKVYYVSINPDYKTIGYTVEYYKDGEIVEEDTQVVTEKVEVLAPDTLIVNKDEINITNKYIGYKFESIDPEVIPDEVTDGDVIKVYYVKDEFEYKVEYYYDGVLDASKTETFTAMYEDKITEYPEKLEPGYNLGNVENLPLIITEKPEENVIRVYYVQQEYSYAINYYYDGVKDESKTEIFYTFLGDEITTYPDKVEENYELEKVETLPLVITENIEENVINVYYIRKDAQVIIEYRDKNTNEELLEKVILDGKAGDEYDITEYQEEIENYTLVEVPESLIGFFTEETQIKVFYYAKNTKVIVNHIDKNTNEILETEEKNGKVGDEYISSSKEFEGYKLVQKPEKEKVIMIEEIITLNYYYIREIKVVVKYLDKETKEKISEEVIIKGYEGDNYKTDSKDIENYKLVEEPENKEGKMIPTKTEDGNVVTVIEVVYYYEKEEVPKPPVQEPDKPEEPVIPDEPDKPQEPKPEEPKKEPQPEEPKEQPKDEHVPENKPPKPVTTIKPNITLKNENTADKILPNTGNMLAAIILNATMLFAVTTLLRLTILKTVIKNMEKDAKKRMR